AAIQNPWKAVHDQIKNHVEAAIEWERKAAEAPDTHPQIRRRYLRNAKENREYANRLKKAVPVLEKNPEKFQEAVRLTRLGSEYVQQGKIARDMLAPDEATIRLQRQAAAATGVRPNKLSVAAEGVDPNEIVNKVVTARDRDNVGTVKSVDAESGTAEVFFHNKATGRKATVTLPLDEILRKDGKLSWEGLPATPEGSFYYPGSAKFRQGAKAKGKPNAPVASPYGISSVTTPSRQGVEGVTGKRFTGSSFDYAQPDVANVVNHQLGSFARFTVMEDTLGELWDMGAKAKRTDRDIPIRDTVTIRAELRNLVQDIEKYGADGDHKMLQSAEDALNRFLKREDDPDINAPVGTELDGVRWVDRSVVKPTTSIYKGAFKFFDVVNQPARFSTLYTRPAYILNLVGNATMGVWDHGIRRYGQSYAKAVNAKSLYGKETEAWMASAMGESKSLSFAPETQTGRMTRSVAGAWNQVTDYHHRLATLIAEADKAGFKTPEAINRLRTDPKLESKRIEIIQRARDSAVDFDSLTPIERDVLTRIIYFYPWVSRGSQWAVRAALDQPLKTLVAAQAGQIGRDEILKMFGNLGPMWQRLAGFVPIHKNKNGLIDVINASSVNTFGTAVGAGAGVVDATKGLIGLAHGKGFTDSVTPALDTIGSQFSDTPGGGGLRGILEQQPLYRIGVNAGLYGKPSKTFPETGAANAAIRWAGGGVGLTGLDPKEREKQYLREQGLSKRGPATAKLKIKDDLAEMQRKAVESGLIGKGQGLPPELRRAWSLRQRRAVVLSTLKRDAEDYQRKAFEADARLLVQMGVLSERDMRAGLAEYADASPEELSAVREKWGYQFFGGSTIRRGWKEIRDASTATP
ncbi:MAG: hypothetical protein IT480_18925, partial [Gammaproteobacteria bacterium]|nr:hypothetical protein [Gammaproteobacteria bacterium]